MCAGTDGSGGTHTADPRLRRVGWSWCLLGPDHQVTLWARGGLAGPRQTVPRSEIYALLHLATHTDGDILVYSDCKNAVDTYRNLQHGWKPDSLTANGDLWGQLALGLADRKGTSTVCKVHSHMTLAEATAAGTPGRRGKQTSKRTS